jgi:hypothetical protein
LTELDLVASIKTAFSAAGSNDWIWISELDSPNGIADLVAVKLSDQRAESQRLSRIPPRWTHALKTLPSDCEFSTDWFAQRAGASATYARSILKLYSDAGFCRSETRVNAWRKIAEPLQITEKIVAIEAKLRDWRRALYQASRYLDYSSESWVVLDAASITPALPYVDDFERRGIGLMGLSRAEQVEVFCRASARTPRSATRLWHANAEIARRLAESSL